jgi:hypothetical protein
MKRARFWQKKLTAYANNPDVIVLGPAPGRRAGRR